MKLGWGTQVIRSGGPQGAPARRTEPPGPVTACGEQASHCCSRVCGRQCWWWLLSRTVTTQWDPWGRGNPRRCLLGDRCALALRGLPVGPGVGMRETSCAAWHLQELLQRAHRSSLSRGAGPQSFWRPRDGNLSLSWCWQRHSHSHGVSEQQAWMEHPLPLN